MFAHLKILLYYYNIRCHNDTHCVTIHQVLSVGAASWWWLSAAETCSGGLMSCICVGMCKLLVLWTQII